MIIAVSGASGMIGRALVPTLATRGHEVRRLVRRTPGAGEIEWDPARGAPSDGTAGCSNRATVIVGADGYLRACDSCAAAPELRRRRSRKPLSARRARLI